MTLKERLQDAAQRYLSGGPNSDQYLYLLIDLIREAQADGSLSREVKAKHFGWIANGYWEWLTPENLQENG